jgi:hypothetical protein
VDPDPNLVVHSTFGHKTRLMQACEIGDPDILLGQDGGLNLIYI